MAAIVRDTSDSIIAAKMRKTEPQSDLCDELLKLEHELCSDLHSLKFSSPVTHVYNPLNYAKETHEDYVRKYCKLGQKVLFLGMNPGPFGMAQNGVSLLHVTESSYVRYFCNFPFPLTPHLHLTPRLILTKRVRIQN